MGEARAKCGTKLRLCCEFCMMNEFLFGCMAATTGCLAVFLPTHQLLSDPVSDLAGGVRVGLLSASLYFLPKRKRGCLGAPSPVSST